MEQHQGDGVAVLKGRSGEQKRQHRAGRIGRPPGCSNDNMHQFISWYRLGRSVAVLTAADSSETARHPGWTWLPWLQGRSSVVALSRFYPIRSLPVMVA